MPTIVLTTAIYPPDIGGPATYVPLIAAGLAEHGWSVTVIAGGPRYEHIECDEGYTVVRFSRATSARYGNFLLTAGRALSCIRALARKADLIYANGLGLEAWLAAKQIGCPFVMKCVGDYAWELAYARGWTKADFTEFQRVEGFWWRLFKSAARFPLQVADCVITPSQFLEATLRSWGIRRSRIRVIANAVPRHQQSTGGVDNLGIWDGSEKLRAAVIGRLVPYKRIDIALHALASAAGCSLVIVGDGPSRSSLEQLRNALGLGDRVVFLGRQSKEGIHLLLESVDVLILPGLYEGFPHTALEAMQHGVPVIASNVCGNPEIIRSGVNGFLVPPCDVEALSCVLRLLVQQPSLLTILGEGARATASRYTPETLVAETVQLLSLVVGRHA